MAGCAITKTEKEDAGRLMIVNSPAANLGVKLLQPFVSRDLSCLYQKESQEPRAVFSDVSDPSPLAGRFLQRIESDKGNGLLTLSKTMHVSERVNDRHRRQIPDARMSEK